MSLGEQQRCLRCGEPIITPAQPHRPVHRTQPGQERQPGDPVIGAVHEWCALGAELKEMTVAVLGANSLAASLLAHAGGCVVLTLRDIARAKEVGNELQVTPLPDGAVEVRLRRQLIIAPT